MPNVIEPQETVIVYVSIPQPVAVTVGVNPITAITIGEQGPPGVVALTTNGNNGAATFSGGNLNVPNYTLSGLGGQPALGYTPANKAGDTFTGNIIAPNLSGTNSGDETNATIIAKIGYTPANKAGDTFTGNIIAPNLSGTNSGDETNATIIAKIGYTPATSIALATESTNRTNADAALSGRVGVFESGGTSAVGLLNGLTNTAASIVAAINAVVSSLSSYATTSALNSAISALSTVYAPINVLVSQLSITAANGLTGAITATGNNAAIRLGTTITGLLKGDGTAVSAAIAATDYQAPAVTLTSNVWYSVPSLFRLIFNGTGNISIDTTDTSGNVVTGAFVYIESGASNDTHTYLSESVKQIRAIFSSGVTVALVS